MSAQAPTASAAPGVVERLPIEWRDLLAPRLDAQAAAAAEPTAYYDGEHPLQFATSKFREAFGAQFEAFADNWCEIVVDAPVERLEVVGFQTHLDTVKDDEAWKIWQANALDLESMTAHTEAGISGIAYLLVDPTPDVETGLPRITVESATQVIVAWDPADRRRRLAALKRWTDDDGLVYANLYLPNMVVKWATSEVPAAGTPPNYVEIPGGPNSLGVVPVIPLENKPRLMLHGESDLKPAIPLQNAVNKLCTDMIVASEYGAYRQRVITGIEVPRDPETGKPIGKAQIESAMSRLWTFEDANSKVTDLPPTDLGNFTNAIQMFIQHLAAQTRTPPHYLLGQITNASGDALKAAEVGLVSKCRRKIRSFSDGWEEAMALALKATGTEILAADCECLWADPEKVSPSQLADAAVKKQTVGVPQPVLWRELGYTPQEIEEMQALNAEQGTGLVEVRGPFAHTAIAPSGTQIAPGQIDTGQPPAGAPAAGAPPADTSQAPAPAPSTPPAQGG